MVAPQYANTADEHAGDPADNHCFAENVMPAAHRSKQQHRAADHESRERDRAREPLEIATEATSESLQTREATQIAFRDAVEDASRAARRIFHQAPELAGKRVQPRASPACYVFGAAAMGLGPAIIPC